MPAAFKRELTSNLWQKKNKHSGSWFGSSCHCTAQQNTANTAQEKLRANKYLRNNQEITSYPGTENTSESVIQFQRASPI